MIKFDFTKIVTVFNKVAGRPMLQMKKFSPEILIATGVVGIGTTIVLACKATLKLEQVIDTAGTRFEEIGKKQADRDLGVIDYSDRECKKDLCVAYTKSGFDIYKLYAPAATVGVVSMTCILSAYNIMNKRNVALMAAYKCVEESFVSYRNRVKAELGEEKDRDFRYGVNKIEHTTMAYTDENGVKHDKLEETLNVVNSLDHSQYARFFDEYSNNWSKTPEYNMVFLKCQQQYANDLLNSRGHVFLNEIYDMLDVPRSQAGAIVGWVKGSGDEYIDFNIFNPSSGDFVNGYERSILLDFNVDGVIYDKI